MTRRMLLVIAAALVALLWAAPALAGGWAMVTLDSLPQDVRADQSFQVGFSIRQHGVDLVNTDWEGRPLKPVLFATLGGAKEGLSFPARQSGEVGHFVVDVTLPEAGEWAWSISAPPFLIQDTGSGTGAVSFEPLVVQPATAPAPIAPASAPVAAPAAVPAQPAGWLDGNRAALRWFGVVLLVLAGGALLIGRRTALARRPAKELGM